MDYINTWKEVMLRPSDFYRSMPKTGGYADPLIFAAISFIIYGLLAALIAGIFGRGMYMGGMYGGTYEGMYGGTYEGMYGGVREFSLFTILTTVIILPIAGIVSLY